MTLFLVNAQAEPDTNRDMAWVFQPEVIVRAITNAGNRAIFRRRPVLDASGMDPERDALEMIYRNRRVRGRPWGGRACRDLRGCHVGDRGTHDRGAPVLR